MSVYNQVRVEAQGKDFCLTPIEKGIIGLVLAGYSDKECAQDLGITEDGLGQHVGDIIAKLGVANRLELALFALFHHLTDPF